MLPIPNRILFTAAVRRLGARPCARVLTEVEKRAQIEESR